MLVRFLLVVLYVAGLFSTSFAQEFPTPVSAILVSDVTTVKPGDSFDLGVFLEIDPGWHVYWKNPGDSGLPTKLVFELPQGFEAANIYWPLPSSFRSPQGGVDFGYENSVLIWTNIDVPEDTDLNASPRIEAEVSWVSCRKICIPGRASLTYNLRLGKKTMQDNADLFSKWNNLLPVDAKHKDSPVEIEVGSTKSANGMYAVELEVKPKSKHDSLYSVEYYPNLGEGFQIENLSYRKLPDESTTKISFDVQSDEPASSSNAELDGLIVYTDANKNHQGIEVKIDLNDS